MHSPVTPSVRPHPSTSPARSPLIGAMALCTLALAVLGAPETRADATLTYELSESGKDTKVMQLSMARFFVRIDDPAEQDRYLLFQAGRFFPLFSVDTAAGTYARLTPPVTPFMSPESRAHHGADSRTVERRKNLPALKPTRKERTVNGIRCRIVHELKEGKPVREHCMANSARLGVTDRDIVNLARVFTMARQRGFGWLGTGTRDETFASVDSRDLRNDRQLTLTSISRTPPPAGYLRIPREYREVSADTPDGETTASSSVTSDAGDQDTQASGVDESAHAEDAATGPADDVVDTAPEAANSEAALSAAPDASTADKSPAPQTGTAAAP